MISYHETIKAKLADLLKNIKRNGFEVFTASVPDFSDKKESSAVFPHFFILDSIKAIRAHPEGGLIADRLTSFLKNQAAGQMSFNYWRRDSEECSDTPYPDDLDSTSMAFASMDLLNGENDGEAMAYLVMMLGAEEVEEGGPYYTWIAPPDAEKWKDVDLAVNANIAYALSKVGVELPNLIRLIEAAIENKEFVSGYYETQFSVAYFISKAYKGSKIKDLKEWFEQNIDIVTNPLDLSFCVLGLMNCGVRSNDLSLYVKKIVDWLDSGSEDIYPFVVETNRSGKKTYSGSHALQIALALEVIDRVEDKEGVGEQADIRLADTLSKIKSALRTDLEGYVNLEVSFERWSERMIGSREKEEIILVASLVFSGLDSGEKAGISDDFLVSLGVISFCGWTAYSIYDDFLDGEGNPPDLPFANYCLKKVLSELAASAAGEFYGLSIDILNRMDAANMWELDNTRLSDSSTMVGYGDLYEDLDILADKSMGHALGPVLILSRLGYAAESSEVSSMMDFFRYYIVARQLNDDLRDCFDDFKKGNVSPAVAALLEIMKEEKIESGDEAGIHKIIWHDVVPLICRISLEYSGMAVGAAEGLSSVGDISGVLLKIISPVMAATERALADRKTYLQFSKTCG